MFLFLIINFKQFFSNIKIKSKLFLNKAKNYFHNNDLKIKKKHKSSYFNFNYFQKFNYFKPKNSENFIKKYFQSFLDNLNPNLKNKFEKIILYFNPNYKKSETFYQKFYNLIKKGPSLTIQNILILFFLFSFLLIFLIFILKKRKNNKNIFIFL